jgi:phospholipase/carboxylesterase
MRKPQQCAWRWVGVCLLVLGGCKEHSRSAPTPSPASTFRPPAHTRTPPAESTTERGLVTARSALHYERLTLGGAPADAELPWIVAFHGLGDTPRGFAQLFDGLPLRAHVYLAQAPISYGSGYDWFGERVTGDPERLALAIARRLEDATTLLDALAEQPRNHGDAVVTGFSQGGVMSFAVAAAGLRHVRAALPLAGWLPPSLAASGPSMALYAFHGEEDGVVPFAATKQLLGSWQQRDRGVEYRAYPGVAHTISAEMHRDWAARLSELMR